MFCSFYFWLFHFTIVSIFWDVGKCFLQRNSIRWKHTDFWSNWLSKFEVTDCLLNATFVLPVQYTLTTFFFYQLLLWLIHLKYKRLGQEVTARNWQMFNKSPFLYEIPYDFSYHSRLLKAFCNSNGKKKKTTVIKDIDLHTFSRLLLHLPLIMTFLFSISFFGSCCL